MQTDTQTKTPSLKAIAEELYSLGIEPDALDYARRRHANSEAESARLTQKATDLASDMTELQRSSDERIGELNLALAAQKEQMAHLERTKSLSLKLIEALEATHACESFKNVWSLAQVHGVEYKGPTYKKEFAELKKEVFA